MARYAGIVASDLAAPGALPQCCPEARIGCRDDELRHAIAAPTLVSLAPGGAGDGRGGPCGPSPALPDRAALSLRQSSLDPDALALGHWRAGGARERVARPDCPDPAADRRLLGGWAFLLPLRHRLGGDPRRPR